MPKLLHRLYMTALSEVAQIFHLGADICNCKSSANEWCMIECESKKADKGLIYIVKSIGPRTEP